MFNAARGRRIQNKIRQDRGLVKRVPNYIFYIGEKRIELFESINSCVYMDNDTNTVFELRALGGPGFTRCVKTAMFALANGYTVRVHKFGMINGWREIY